KRGLLNIKNHQTIACILLYILFVHHRIHFYSVTVYFRIRLYNREVQHYFQSFCVAFHYHSTKHTHAHIVFLSHYIKFKNNECLQWIFDNRGNTHWIFSWDLHSNRHFTILYPKDDYFIPYYPVNRFIKKPAHDRRTLTHENSYAH